MHVYNRLADGEKRKEFPWFQGRHSLVLQRYRIALSRYFDGYVRWDLTREKGHSEVALR